MNSQMFCYLLTVLSDDKYFSGRLEALGECALLLCSKFVFFGLCLFIGCSGQSDQS